MKLIVTYDWSTNQLEGFFKLWAYISLDHTLLEDAFLNHALDKIYQDSKIVQAFVYYRLHQNSLKSVLQRNSVTYWVPHDETLTICSSC